MAQSHRERERCASLGRRGEFSRWLTLGYISPLANSCILLTQVEYLVVAVDEHAKKARLSLAQADILKSLARDEALWKEKDDGKNLNSEELVNWAIGMSDIPY